MNAHIWRAFTHFGCPAGHKCKATHTKLARPCHPCRLSSRPEFALPYRLPSYTGFARSQLSIFDWGLLPMSRRTCRSAFFLRAVNSCVTADYWALKTWCVCFKNFLWLNCCCFKGFLNLIHSSFKAPLRRLIIDISSRWWSRIVVTALSTLFDRR